MIRAVGIRLVGDWTGDPVDSITLDYDDRHRRRLMLTGVRGFVFLLDLARAVTLKEGDALVLEDGRLIAVRAAPEKLIEIRCRDAHHLSRVAWHLGNRHLPTEIHSDRLLVRDDHVIADMLTGLGAEITRIEAPFQPEGCAYGDGRGNAHGHGHG